MADDKKVQKVVQGEAKLQKPNKVESFFASSMGAVKDYAIKEVIAPSLLNLLTNVLHGSIDMLFYGSTKAKGGNNSNWLTSKPQNGPYVNYGSVYGGQSYTQYGRQSYNYSNIILPSRQDADSVLMQMDELIDTYGMASVADLYECAGLPSDYTAHKYGWKIREWSQARVEQRKEGFLLVLPQAHPIN